MEEPPLTELEKFRRIIIVIQCAALNFGYFRGAKAMMRRTVDGNFLDIQRRIDNNFLDMGIIEFCKLFAERESQHWSRVINPDLHKEFENGLYKVVDIDRTAWKRYVDEFLSYRDKFLAHLDKNRVMKFPNLGLAIKALHYYAQFLRTQHPLSSSLEDSEFDVETLVSKSSRTAQKYLP
ncbi:hypothetical protein DLM45_06475 [Hyphomicrobium methylovorum]|uniref:hypothetical protein n=1 Tax=Hyphomicrobium methylovorum TaxID=84 RepID=UPI0015E6B00B|nr:hypothetical protein [Hyphomicrobium methylovorum]MBA2125867.1 hypothetical protein [Hyphomicrobium methylovorum]